MNARRQRRRRAAQSFRPDFRTEGPGAGNPPRQILPWLRGGIRGWWVLAVLTAALGRASGQGMRQNRISGPDYAEPQWLNLHLSEVSAGVYSEGTFDQTVYRDSHTVARHDYFYIGPSLGLDLDGSVYHPNLLRFSIASEGSSGWGWETVETETTRYRRSELQYLGWFAANADLLAEKPVRLNVYGNYDHSFRDNDFFNRVTVDSWRYGSRLTYEQGPWQLQANYSHRDEELSSINGQSEQHYDLIEASAHYQRHSGSTRLNYTFNRYTQNDLGVEGAGTDQTISLSDAEHFGSREQFRLNSSINYSLRDSYPEGSRELTAQTELTADHSHHLTSAFNLDFDRYTSGAYEGDNASGEFRLTHRLFDSLTSSLVARASDFESSDDTTEGYTRRFGAGLVETYTKQLAANHRLRISNSAFLDHTDQESTTTIENEKHTFSEGPADSFFLNYANVRVNTIQITDLNHTQPGYIEGIDYFVLSLDTRVQIQRPVGSRIPTGAAVLVRYETEPTPGGSYETLTENFQIRFELWKNLLGLYGRLDLSLDNAPSELLVQNLKAYTFGADATWRWLRGGVEYEIYDSDQVVYNATRLFQSLMFRPDEGSTWSFDFTETWIDYHELRLREEDYRFMTRYHRALTRRLSLDAAAGVALRRGLGMDETQFTVRPAIRYTIGKLSIDATYDYEYQLYADTQELQQHLFYLRLKRVF